MNYCKSEFLGKLEIHKYHPLRSETENVKSGKLEEALSSPHITRRKALNRKDGEETVLYHMYPQITYKTLVLGIFQLIYATCEEWIHAFLILFKN